MWRKLICILFVAMLAACKTAPPAIVGPSATIADTAIGGGAGGATFFYLASVNGQEPYTDARRESFARSSGQGVNMRLAPVERQVAAGRTRIKIAGRFEYAAPIQHLFQRGGYGSIETEIDVELSQGARYRVNGVLDAYRREIWLEDVASGQPVAPKYSLGAPAAPTGQGPYTCCNLRYEDDWISDGNWASLPMIPAGAHIEVKGYGRHRADVLIDGRPMRIGLDFGREQMSTQQFVERLIAKEDPRPRIEGFAPAVREAIGTGKVAVGMTREQVVLSLGPPRADRTRSFDAPHWVYFTYEEEEYTVVFDTEGRVTGIEATPKVKGLVAAPPRP